MKNRNFCYNGGCFWRKSFFWGFGEFGGNFFGLWLFDEKFNGDFFGLGEFGGFCHFERSEKSKEFKTHFEFVDTSLSLSMTSKPLLLVFGWL